MLAVFEEVFLEGAPVGVGAVVCGATVDLVVGTGLAVVVVGIGLAVVVVGIGLAVVIGGTVVFTACGVVRGGVVKWCGGAVPLGRQAEGGPLKEVLGGERV